MRKNGAIHHIRGCCYRPLDDCRKCTHLTGIDLTASEVFQATHSAVILRSRALARRLEGPPRALAAHPSRLAVKNGEHLRMTASFDSASCLAGRTASDRLHPFALTLNF